MGHSTRAQNWEFKEKHPAKESFKMGKGQLPILIYALEFLVWAPMRTINEVVCLGGKLLE